MANYLAHNGASTVAVIVEDAYIGREYLAGFREYCRFEGLRVVAEEWISQISTDLREPVTRLKDAKADSIAYFGFGLPAVLINRELAALGWDPMRVMTTAFLTAPFTPEGMKALNGWSGVDQYDEENLVGQAMLDRFSARHGYRPENFMVPYCYDLASTVAHAIANAHPISAAGVKRGLERVKMLLVRERRTGHLHQLWSSYASRMARVPLSGGTKGQRGGGDVTIFANMGTTLEHRMTARTAKECRPRPDNAASKPRHPRIVETSSSDGPKHLISVCPAPAGRCRRHLTSTEIAREQCAFVPAPDQIVPPAHAAEDMNILSPHNHPNQRDKRRDNADSVSPAQPSGAMRPPSFCDTRTTWARARGPDASHVKRRQRRPVRKFGDGREPGGRRDI